MCVCVCVCVCVFTSIHREGFICLDRWYTREQIIDVVLKTLNSYADSLHRYFRMQNLTFQLASLSWSHTRSWQSHALTSVRLAFRTWDLHSALTGVAFGTHYIVSRSVFASAFTRGFAIYLGKAKVTANFSIEFSSRQSTYPSPNSFISGGEGRWGWISSLVSDRDCVVLWICLDIKFHWPEEGLNYKSLACEIVS